MATTPPHADRGAPTAYIAGPRTLAERLRHLELDARKILEQPDRFDLEVVRWAEAMVASRPGPCG